MTFLMVSQKGGSSAGPLPNEDGGRRTAIVTGAASGIGRAVCIQLARENVDIVAADLNGQGAASTAGDVKALGRAAFSFALDVADRRQVSAMVEGVQGEWKHVDILVNCAGVFPRTAIVDLEESEWDRVIGAHLKGTFLCRQAVLPGMIARRSGRIVNTTSGLANAGQARTAAYAAAKGGIISLTRVLATEAEPCGITVNAYSPGITDTPMVKNAQTPESLAQLALTCPFGRLATPEESANIAVWFTRPETAHITGRVFLG